MWWLRGLIFIIVVDAIDVMAAFQSRCVLNYLVEEQNSVGVLIYDGKGKLRFNVFEVLAKYGNLTWTVVNENVKGNVVGPPANYLIFASGINESELLYLMKRAISTLSKNENHWEPSARMILFPAVETACNTTDLAGNLMIIMWKKMIFDAVVMLHEDDNSWSIYDANPFDEGNKCGRVVQRLRKLSCNGSTYNDAESTTWRLPHIFPNCSLKVARREVPPFCYRLPNGDWSGAESKFVRLIAKRKNLSIIWSQTPAPESGITAKIARSHISNLSSGKLDMAIGKYLVQSKYLTKLHHLRTHGQISFEYYVADSQNMKGWDILHSMFSLRIWIILFAAIFLGGICYGHVSEDKYFTGTKILVMVAIFVTQTIDMPKRWRSRVFLTLFLFPLYHISTLYSTTLQSFMLHTPKEREIATEEDMFKANLTVIMGDSTRDLLFNNKNHRNFETSFAPLHMRLHELNENRNLSVLANHLEVAYWKNKHHFEIHAVRPSLGVHAISIIMGKGNMYYGTVDEMVQKCLEAGLFQKWIGNMTDIKKSTARQVVYETGAEALDMEDLQCAALLLMTGHFVALTVFLFELLFNKWQNTLKKLRSDADKLRRRRLKKFLEHYVLEKQGLF